MQTNTTSNNNKKIEKAIVLCVLGNGLICRVPNTKAATTVKEEWDSK